MDVSTLLQSSLSTDQAIREDATAKLEQMSRENYAAYVSVLSQVFSSDQADGTLRQLAGLALKNSLTARENTRKEEYAQRWLAVDQGVRNEIKQTALKTFASTGISRSTAPQVVSAIAEIELPANQWSELIPTLLDNVTNQESALLRQASLQALGYICESTEPMVLAINANEILTAVVQGARKEETNDDVRIEALHALYNSLEFIRANFEREGERNFIMQVVCEATQNSDERIQLAAFECLVRVMHLYYDKMRFYMEKALFGLTVLGMNSEHSGVALQAVEFWSTVCDEELELQEEANEALEIGEQPERVSFDFAKTAAPEILPVLLWMLTQQEEDADEDEWNIAMAAGTCLALLAQTITDHIVPPVIPFVESNIQSTEWRYREAAVMAFGSILEGPNPQILTPLVNQALPTLINMMRDPDVNVKDTVTWTLGRVSDVLVECIKPDIHLPQLIRALVDGLQDSPRIVGNCCWSLMNLAEQLSSADDTDAETSPLSGYFEGVITALLRVTDRQDNEANSRTSAYEAISTFVSTAAKDCNPNIEKVAITVLERLEHTLAVQNQLIGSDEQNAHYELQSNLLSVLTNCVRKLGKIISGIADRIMTVFLQILNSQSKHSTTKEDVFIGVGALISALESDFGRYLEQFIPILYNALQHPEEYQLCGIAIGLIGDICRALGEASIQYCNAFMELLVQNLQSPVLHRNVKPAILSCLGDIALAIGGQFEAYLNITMMVLQQAGNMRADKTNLDMIEYVNQLHEGNVEAYVGIVQGLASDGKTHLIAPYVPAIFTFLSIVAEDEYKSDTLVRSLVGLIGDLADALYATEGKQFFQVDWITQTLREARSSRHYSQSTKEVARWAKEMVKRTLQS
ncbi:karyopherin Kap95 [Umbelopsis nana]